MKAAELVPGGWAQKAYLPQLWMHYKLTSDAFGDLWARQDGKCAGCKATFAHPWMKSLVLGVKCEVDHRHVEYRPCEAEDVRGLLCRRCNDFLGKIQDNLGVLTNLVQYLKQHGDYK